MKNLLIVLLSLIVVGCNSTEERPELVISKEEMINVMTDVQIAESFIKLKFALRNDSVQLTDSIYNAIFKKYNLTKESYDSSFSYYVSQPEVLQEIYEAAIINLSALDAKNEGDKLKSKKVDSLPTDPVIP
jgi:hypothetical protein